MLYHVRILLVEEKVPRQPSFPRTEIGLFPEVSGGVHSAM